MGTVNHGGFCARFPCVPEPRTFAVTPNDRKDVPSLVEGSGKLRCPHCEQIGRLDRDFKVLSRNELYAMELNYVHQHRKDRGGCGHIFSLGDQRITIAFLEGKLVPREMLDELMARYEALAGTDDNQANNGSQAHVNA